MIDRRSSAHVGAMTSLLIVVFAGAARAGDLRREVDALRPNDVAGRGAAMLDNLERRAREALAAIPRSRTAGEADRAAAARAGAVARRRAAALAPRAAAARRRHPEARGYRIEKVVYESLPGARVPAHLYVPERLDGPAPAVLFYPGHWWPDSKACPDFQAFCITMARLGFVVLTFDPFGQGERGVSARDHRRTVGSSAPTRTTPRQLSGWTTSLVGS